MNTTPRLIAGALAAGGLALLSACGSSSSTSTNSNPFVGGSLGAGGNGSISIPTLPGGLPGISSSSSSSAGGGSVDACTAMSASAASQISGANVTKLGGQNAGGVSECTYADTSGSGAGATALIENIPGLTGSTALQAAMSQAAHGGSGSTEPVSGLGDTALKDVEAHSATVAFAKGSTLVVIAVYGSTRDGGSIESDIESLAHTIAGQV